ncbi:hypothetical protein BM524_08240 [Alteromonas mediterranea]|uniref:Uncharacterized protein n=1 Tax=Alteromonas mediterranea TaxID=314275 RepID=A0AAC9J9J1_9ALTE|nr:hypothetical protein [Alteromonas mediterranea]APD89774.1 hypothetical protein BM524_08240 [Alteromonas mediterranea]
MNSEERIHPFFHEHRSSYLEILQNSLLKESTLIKFTKDRGFSVSGVVAGDPSIYSTRGWLEADNANTDKLKLYHPFRLYPLHVGGELSKLNITPLSSLNRDSLKEAFPQICDHLPPINFIREQFEHANLVATLAILLEPIFWPKITSRISYPAPLTEEEHTEKLKSYKEKVLHLVSMLDPSKWYQYHQKLRIEAAKMDDNNDLYILLRLSPWSKMKNIKDQIGGALWLRLIAEVIRRAFMDVHSVEWPEEDEAFGKWSLGAREKHYGTKFPTDDTLIAKQYLAFEFGLHTGSTACWYLEGETEFSAASYCLPGAASGGIELINVKGALGRENPSTPLRIEDCLAKDAALKRFSFISFDGDVSSNVKFFKAQASRGNIVGYVNCNSPDFEFDNFTIDELVEVAARLDENEGGDTQDLRNYDWSGVKSGKEFETRYKSLSKIGQRGLKGQRWGEALAQYAWENSMVQINGRKRPFFETLNVILRSRRVKYDYQRDNFYICPETFEIKAFNS